jgi:DNA repair protein RecO
MTRKVKGILLRIGQTVHDERVLTVLTEELGCISVFAKVSRKKTQYDQFYYGEWVLYETQAGNFRLNSFFLEEPFHELKERIENTFLASYLSQLVLHFCRWEPRETGVLLSLLLNALFLLGKGRDPLQVKAVFELKTMQLMGYCPTLAPCEHSGGWFSLEDGSLLCDQCALSVKALAASATSIAAMAHILNHSPQKAYGFRIPGEDMVNLSKLTEAFALYQLDFKASALDMWKTVYEG